MSDLFELLPEDVDYLDANHEGRWSKLNEGSGKYGLLIERFGIPNGFTQSIADLMVLIPAGYPGSSLDMFYLDPPLSKLNGRDAGALSIEKHFARRWQRWSRHYQWKPGEDNLALHVEYVWRELREAGLK
ncbi:MAG: hypothetical protein OXC66_08660 [Roseovarius sp.]|nr:hypothetical protein [Roseovarius sp.]